MSVMFSLILPVLNPGRWMDSLLPCLEKLNTQYGVQCIVVDSGSTDGSLAQWQRSGAIELYSVKPQTFDHGGTRNWALQWVKHELVVFMTQDALPFDTEDLIRLCRAFDHPDVGAAYARQCPRPETSFFGGHLRAFNYPEQPYVRNKADIERYGLKAAFLSNSCCAYRLQDLFQVGGFPERLILGEDMVVGAQLLKAGRSLAYVADAQVWHAHDYSIGQECRRYFDIGVMHASQPWLLSDLGSPEGEGWRFVRSEWKMIAQQRRWGLWPISLVRNAFKLLGYRLGRLYRYWPVWLNRHLSMHRSWW